VDGRVLHFYLAGINDENFLMRDRETGSWWQQVSGRAIAGPLRGARLRLLSSEEISFGLWRREYPWGTVLAPVAADRKNYVRAGWVKRYHKYPVVVPLPHGPLQGRTLVVGVTLAGHSVAYPLAQVAKQGVIEDTLGDTPILVALGPDQRTVRVFVRRAPGLPAADSFFKEVAAPAAVAKTRPGHAGAAKPPARLVAAAVVRPAVQPGKTASKTAAPPNSGGGGKAPPAAHAKKTAKASKPFALAPWKLLDAATGSQWDFRGCAIQGKAKGRCLPILPSLTEDWFDWHHYHPESRVWSAGLPR
jgi:hypothetical protein